MNANDIVLSQLVKRDASKPDSTPAMLGEAFLIAATPLLAIAARMKRLSPEMDPVQLQQYLIREIHQFELHLQQRNIRAEQILIAKYFICSLLDDVIENEWLNSQGLWRAYTLRFHFFQENSQDERVFAVIERLQQEPTINIALLELAYMILVYGYQGHYRQSNNGYHKLLARIDELYHILNWQYGDFRKSLFIQQRS